MEIELRRLLSYLTKRISAGDKFVAYPDSSWPLSKEDCPPSAQTTTHWSTAMKTQQMWITSNARQFPKSWKY